MKEPSTPKNADILIKKARILWPGSEHHDKELDLSVRGGSVEKMGEKLEASADQKLIQHDRLHLSPGWMDLNCHFRDPGEEEKEDLHSGIGAAMQGGYTRGLVMPSTTPPIDHRGAVEDLRSRSRDYPFTLHPAGALSKGREGRDIAELYDMQRAGASAFTDGRRPVTDAGLLTNALLYARTFDGRILLYPDDPTVSRNGVMHEGELSIKLGMKGVPGISERIAVDRALHLLRYTEGNLHFSTISTFEALESIRAAKQEGLQVTCDVAAHHLFFDEERVRGFSSLFKVMPPLRHHSHVEALKEGVRDGTIDHICSLHEPQAEEDKRVEFDVAGYGIPGLETAFGASRSALYDELPLERLIDRLSIRPRLILGMKAPELKEGVELEATLFDPEEKWTCHAEDLRTKAYRSPYLEEELMGRPLGTVHRGLFQSAFHS